MLFSSGNAVEFSVKLCTSITKCIDLVKSKTIECLKRCLHRIRDSYDSSHDHLLDIFYMSGLEKGTFPTGSFPFIPFPIFLISLLTPISNPVTYTICIIMIRVDKFEDICISLTSLSLTFLIKACGFLSYLICFGFCSLLRNN